MRSILGKAAVTLGAAAAVLSLAAGNAVADPGFTPLTGDIVGVGSDTSQDLLDGLASQYNSETARPGDWLASWRATGSATITPKTGAAEITRPNGSSAGINALIADGDAHTIDFARSSRWVGSNPAEANYSFLQFARDGLTFATATNSNVPATRTTAQLHDIYSRSTPNCVPLVKPYIPQPGSGTRQFFLASIGLTEGTLGNCAAVSQEHDASVVVNDANAIAPFSIARGWGVQGLRLGDVDDSSRPAGLPANLIAQDTPPNGALATINVYDRGIYNVVRNSDVNLPKYDNVFGPNGWICTDPDAQAIITGQHFRLADSLECGQHVK
ncbi:substrate-binding domain-containing protein [Kibdelosporangium persicum]|uniref:ABC-type phosphate transport system substrate-binding protein n=1 Tax=Kibdelosporangium persicum TaxID=2698649 RepID=A0ABX2FAA9_9PSEU|nr:substrate-binding domain-containing protein [Kibdelosporangium persicum]NRN67865.1 ABC-type phosphate transport system substrate-binding protein [Kibdelosporangium persicum]